MIKNVTSNVCIFGPEASLSREAEVDTEIGSFVTGRRIVPLGGWYPEKKNSMKNQEFLICIKTSFLKRSFAYFDWPVM